VEAGFAQVKRIPGAVKSPSIDQCKNPALDILNSAPKPDPCSKKGATCAPGEGNPAGTTGDDGSSGDGTGTDPGTGATGPGTPGSTDGTGDGTAVDPLTGATTGGAQTTAAGAPGTPISLTGGHSNQTNAASLVAALALGIGVLAPPLLVRRLRRR
jgi:hypothetical protein